MEQAPCFPGAGICPICSLNQDNLIQHLTIHSKEEIIQVLSPQNLGRENVNNLNQFGESSSPAIQSPKASKPSNSISPQEYPASTQVQSGSSLVGSILSTASLLPYQNTLSIPAPLLTGIKNSGAGANTSVLPSTFPPMRTAYIPNGSASAIPQFASPSFPVLYRHPNPGFQNSIDGNNTPIVLQSPQINLNSYKGFPNQNVLGSYGIGPSLVNQPSPLPQSAEISLPSTSTGSQILSPATSAGSIQPSPVKMVSDMSGLNTVQTNTFPSNVSATAQGQHPLLCILPFAQIQPSVPTQGNYFLYGNSILPGSNMVPDMLQQTGVNYMLGTNTAAGLPINNSQFPNNMYYLPSNMPQFGLKQPVPSSSQAAPGASTRPVFAENMVQASYTKISSSSTQTIFNPASSNVVLNQNNENVSEEQNIQIDTNSVVHERSPAQESVNDECKTTTIEVGNNIKISLPKDMVQKKERLKELINRELVRAILINDSEEELSISKEEIEEDTTGSPSGKQKPFDKLKSSISSERNNSIDTEIDKKSVNTFTISCNPNNPRYINFGNLQIDPNLPSSGTASIEDSHFKSNYMLPLQRLSGNTSNEKSLSPNKIEEEMKNHIIDLSTTSHIDALFTRTKDQLKQTNDKYLPSSSDIEADIKFKNECHSIDDPLADQSLNILAPEKNYSFLGDTVFSDITYDQVEDQVLGTVEEVFANENSIQSTSIDCKSMDLSLTKASTCFYGTQNVSFESQISSDLSNEDDVMQNPEDDFETTIKMNSLKYSKTYFRVKKSNHLPSISTTSEGDLSQFIADTSQINVKLQDFSEHMDEEIVDDPSYEEMETNGSGGNETFSSVFSNKGIILREEESFSDDSKDVGTSLYQGVPLKIENGESNGTHTEEIMSLKASETLADSDSERATPSEEMAEMYYGKSCIFAGEPGPPNLSSQEYPPIEDSEDHLSIGIMAETEPAPGPHRHSGDAPTEDTISLTLDANCSILPADTLHFPQLFEQSSPVAIGKRSLLKEEVWIKPVTNWSKLQEESKPFVTTGIVESYSSSISPHASTSGLQSPDYGMVKKAFREDEEYDFEYESDCYGDSDSDVGHLQKGPLDLERWRCNKCNKTFKSLKEKLLHSGHHLPCSSSGKTATTPPEKGFLVTIESTTTCNYEEEVRQTSETITSSIVVKGRVSEEDASSPRLVFKATRSRQKKDAKKFKEEKKEEEETPEEDCQVTRSLTSFGGDFKCSECPLTFPTVDNLYNHRVTSFKSRYICPICHLEFKKRIGKLRHMKLHPLSELKCLICHRNFDSCYSWSQHQLFHMGLVVFECMECGHKCQRKGELEIHLRKHSGEKPFKCETCFHSFVSSHSLKRHLVVHMEGQETECDVCHKRYKNAIGLAKHKLKIHPKKKKVLKKRQDFMCDTCNEVFHSEKKLAWHQETHERWPKKCQQCGECFIHKSNLTKHIRFKHDPDYIPAGSKKESVPCTVCKKTYKRSSLSLHMRTHTGVKPYKCNVCSKEFTVKCNYLSHKWVHTGVRDRPYKCKLCERSFHRKRFLEAHIRSHKKIRPYTCNECGKSFIHKSNYQTHSRHHTEEKQHECGYCGKMFYRKYNLNNHVRIHTGETPFECTICKKEFTQKSNFNVHMKAFHVERHAIHEEV